LRQATHFAATRPTFAAPFHEMTALCRRLHSERPFDAVVAATTTMAVYALKLPSMPRILEEHNSQTRWMYDRYQAQASPMSQVRCWASWHKSRLFEARLFRRFDLVTMASELDVAVSRCLLPEGTPPVLLVPNGVDCARFRPGLAAAQAGRLVFGGALSYDANMEGISYFLSKVYPQARRQHPGIHLHITGSTQGVDLARLPLDGSVTLTGFVDDVRPEIASACVAIAPILSGGGTRIKILEAMALGTPVVSTSKGAEGLEVTPGEDILIADTAQEYLEAILRLVDAPELRTHLARNARQLVVRKYDWGRIGQRFCQMLRNVVSQDTGPQDAGREAAQ
jgi:glycosyltransferase involved in cell wall biosynthesis